MAKKRFDTRKQKSKFEKLTNAAISRKYDTVRVVGEHCAGEFPTNRAWRAAEELGLDLVLINSKTEIPICKIIDYKKYLYDAKKQEKKQNAIGAKTKTKGIKLGLDISDNDMGYRVKNAVEFLEKKNKVKISLRIRGGRTMVRKNEGGAVIKTFVNKINALGLDWEAIFESQPSLQGKNWSALISNKPRKKEKKKK